MNKIFVKYVEFYITNVCNLTCSECNRFNHLNFKGWQKWQDFANVYEKWSKEINLGSYSIMGGETLLNPSLYEWIDGLQKLWPNTQCKIASNGTQLDQHKDLYEYLIKYKNSLFLQIACHNEQMYENLKNKIRNFLKKPINEEFDDSQFKKYYFFDKNGIKIRLSQEWIFQKNALLVDEKTKQFTLHQSNREKAHLICWSKSCHHFDKGELFKCAPSSLFKQVDKQFNLYLSDDDRKLIENYKPLNVNDSLETKKKFIKNLPNSISLCKFCPSSFARKKFYSIEKKEQ